MELASPFVPHGFTASPFMGARRPHPFSRSSFSPASVERLAIASALTSVQGGYAFFLLRAVLPAGLHTICQPFREINIDLMNKFSRCIGRKYPSFIKPAIITLILAHESSNNF
jgi:hypothetical protein